MIFVDSTERAPGALLTLEGNAWVASQEACALLEDRAQTVELLLDDEVANVALPAEEVGGLHRLGPDGLASRFLGL